MGAHLGNVRLGLAQIAGCGLRGRQDLHQLPAEADIHVATRVSNREVVKLPGGHLLVFGHVQYPVEVFTRWRSDSWTPPLSSKV